LTAEARICPRCSSEMVLRTAGRGPTVGQRFWGCSRFPSCRAVLPVEGAPATSADPEVPPDDIGALRELVEEFPAQHGWAVSIAGGSAQAEFERRRVRNRARVRRQWPYALGCGVVLTVIVGAVVQSVLREAAITALVVAAIGLAQLTGFLQNSTVRSWGVGAEGERKTAAALEPLRAEGFVILHDRKVTGYGGNLDHLVIGPTGLWAVETKNLAGKVVIHGDTLRVGGHRRDKIIDQVKQEATIIQVVLGESLAARGLRVTPVICLHRGELPFFNKSVRGVRLASGRQLIKMLRSGNQVLSASEVEALAREADELLMPAVR